VPGQYPISPTSYLLINDGTGHFAAADVPFKNVGMVTDAVWHDWDGDARPDLLLAGEMMPLTLYLNKTYGFEENSSLLFPAPAEGFWTALALADLNADGKMDLVAGNIGENVPFKISTTQPATLVYADFDNNGSIDPFFNFYLGQKAYPYVSRDELNEQIYAMRRKFTSYAAYADAQLHDIIEPEALARAAKLQATEQRSMVFLNTGGVLKANALPTEAQFSNTAQVLVQDFDGDGHLDILTFGNQFDNRLKMGAIGANQGCLLVGDGTGHFSYLPQYKSGLGVRGQVKSALTITSNGKRQLVVAASNEPLQQYEW
jgi:enediyne biosynthesis protein E4